MKKNDGFYRAYAHGICKGKEGPMGIGLVVVNPEGQVIRQLSEWGHTGTKERAEYLAVVYALEEAYSADVLRVELRTDSELVVRQLDGEFQGEDIDLKDLHHSAASLLEAFESSRYVYWDREEMLQADTLARAGFDEDGAPKNS